MSATLPRRLNVDTPARDASPLAALPLYLGVVADTFGGLMHGVFPLALAVRALLLVLFVVWVFESPQTPVRLRVLLLVVMLYLGGSLFVHYLADPVMPLIAMDLSASLRLLYAPLLLGYVAATMRSGLMTPEHTRRVAVVFGWLVLLSLFLGKVTGLGGEIGGRGTDIEAGKGFMIGANEVGLMLILSCPFVVADLQRRLGSLAVTAPIALALYGTAGAHVFTKSALVAPIVCAVCLYGLSRERGAMPFTVARLLLLAAAIGIALTGLQFLDVIMAVADSTFFRALFNEGLTSFLFRGRVDYFDALFQQLSGSEWNALILTFGIGEYTLRQMSLGPLSLGAQEGTNFEMDFFDLVGAFGLVGAVLYGALLVRTFRMLPSHGPLRSGMGFAVGATALHAVLAGHVLFSPQVMTLLILCFAAAVRLEVRPSATGTAPAPAA